MRAFRFMEGNLTLAISFTVASFGLNLFFLKNIIVSQIIIPCLSGQAKSMSSKKIVLVVPALPEVRVTKENRLEHKKLFTLPYLGVLLLAAVTPDDYEVSRRSMQTLSASPS
jgi:hypothetical protein